MAKNKIKSSLDELETIPATVETIQKTWTVNIPLSGWSSSQTNGYYTNQITVSGMSVDYNPLCDVLITSADLAESEIKALGKIIEIETFDGYVIAKALEVPEISINVRFKGV